MRKRSLTLTARHFPSHLGGGLVLPEANVDRSPQQSVAGPTSGGDLCDQLRFSPMN